MDILWNYQHLTRHYIPLKMCVVSFKMHLASLENCPEIQKNSVENPLLTCSSTINIDDHSLSVSATISSKNY